MPCPSMDPKWFWTVQIILVESTKHFGWVQFVLVGYKSFWTGPNYKNYPRKFNLDLTKMIWTRPNQIGPVQNYWYLTKMIWTVQNNFGPIEGKGIIIIVWILFITWNSLWPFSRRLLILPLVLTNKWVVNAWNISNSWSRLVKSSRLKLVLINFSEFSRKFRLLNGELIRFSLHALISQFEVCWSRTLLSPS